ncbi:MAG: GNAT family N-acetyltransferase [Euzebyales bacterium]|nr:GNAT family N-acetyltransferase [Euzebyales bacterium]
MFSPIRTDRLLIRPLAGRPPVRDLGVTRAVGMLHPDNPASAMVLERTGFLFEGHTRSSTWVGDECSDDWIYGLTRPDWEQWRDRPRTPPDDLRLAEITAENVRTVGRLTTHRTQERLVAPVQASFGDALFPEIDNGAPLEPCGCGPWSPTRRSSAS